MMLTLSQGTGIHPTTVRITYVLRASLSSSMIAVEVSIYISPLELMKPWSKIWESEIAAHITCSVFVSNAFYHCFLCRNNCCARLLRSTLGHSTRGPCPNRGSVRQSTGSERGYCKASLPFLFPYWSSQLTYRVEILDGSGSTDPNSHAFGSMFLVNCTPSPRCHFLTQTFSRMAIAPISRV